MILFVPPDLTSWIPIAGWLTLGIFALVRYVRKGRLAERSEQQEAIDKAVAAAERRANESDKLATVWEKKSQFLEMEVDRITRDKVAAEEQRDRLVQTVLRAEADIKELKDRVDFLEGHDHKKRR